MSSLDPEQAAERVRVVEDVAVSYTVRELLGRIEERLIRLEERTNRYATAQDVEDAAGANRERLEALSVKIDKLESVRDKMMGAAFAVGALAGGGAGWVANLVLANGGS